MVKEKVRLKIVKKDSTTCPNCATGLEVKMVEEAMVRLMGVSKAKYDEITGNLFIEYDSNKITLSKIITRLEKLGYRRLIK